MGAPGDNHDDDLWKAAVSLDQEGRLHGITSEKRASETRPAVPPPEEPLELVERPRPANPPGLVSVPARPGEDPPPPEPLRSTGRWKLVGGAIILGACVFAAAHFLRKPVQTALEGSAAHGVPVLTVDSLPSDAVVTVDGAEVGHTPYVGTNEFPGGETARLRVAKRGYTPWVATFRGGVDVRVMVPLRQ